MEPRIDVHLLTLHERVEWRDACIASLEGAPIQLHVLPGIAGRLGAARAAGFVQGSLPLVSFVDPDDWYEANAFTQLADTLESHPHAALAYTDEALMDENAKPITVRRLAYSRWQHAHSASHVHGLIVMRRAAVEAVLDHIADANDYPDWLLTRLLAQRGSVLHLPIVGRHWRQHPRQGHRCNIPDAARHVRNQTNQLRR